MELVALVQPDAVTHDTSASAPYRCSERASRIMNATFHRAAAAVKAGWGAPQRAVQHAWTTLGRFDRYG